MKGRIFAVIFAAIFGFAGIGSATAQRSSVAVHTPGASVNVNQGYGGGHGPRHHMRHGRGRHRGYGARQHRMHHRGHHRVRRQSMRGGHR